MLSLFLAAAACGGSGAGAALNATPSASSAPSVAPQALPAGTYSTTAPCGWKSTTTYTHVIWIFMENRTFSQVLGASAPTPHLKSFVHKCGVAMNYTAVTHPSLPNYLAASSGTNGSVTTDCDPSSCSQNRTSLFQQIVAAGHSWRAYAESMPSNCYLSNSGNYAPRHNPAVYFLPIRSKCKTNDIPMGGSSGAFATALANRTLPSFSFVTPNLCNDGHNCSTSTADTWIGTWVGKILTSASYKAGHTLVFLTWDEGVGSNQRIATVVMGPTVPRGLQVTTSYTHYSLLRTTEEILGLAKLGHAATAHSMRTGFHI